MKGGQGRRDLQFCFLDLCGVGVREEEGMRGRRADVPMMVDYMGFIWWMGGWGGPFLIDEKGRRHFYCRA